MLFRSDVLCIGSATLDTFLTVEMPLRKIKLGDKVLVKEIETHSGGGASNAAISLIKFGLKVRILTKLGQDHNAEFIIKELQQHHVENICLHHSRKPTDSASIIDYKKDGDRVIYVHKGASEDLTQEDFKFSDLKTNWIYLATLMGTSFNTGKKIAAYVKKKNIPILFNPSLYLAKKGKIYLKSILEATEILVLNWEEALALLGKHRGNPKEVLVSLQELGPKIVIVTNGKNKMYAVNHNEFYSLQPPKIKVIHAAGAGDSFTAAFLAAHIKGYPFEECLKVGQANASSVIQSIGVKHKLLNEAEARDLIKRYNIKVSQYGILF
ncbi:MAG: carbohydrate kinase family protein [Candidatus Woesearchaeota archaeon]